MNWDITINDMLEAMQQHLDKDWPKMKNATAGFLQQRYERLSKMHELYHTGDLEKNFLYLRLLEEELLLQSEMNALAITSIAAIRRATRAAFRVLIRSIF